VGQGYVFGRFRQWKSAFHAAPELPFSELLSAVRIEARLKQIGCSYRERVYPPQVTLWMFLSQVLSPDSSCRDTVARLLAYRTARGLSRCSADTSSYCEARKKLPEELIRGLVRDTGRELSAQASDRWCWLGRRVRIVDGTTCSMPDTAENEKAFGKPRNQRGPCGFPMARVLVVLCLATGAALDLALGPCRGKKTGELSLFRSLKKTFEPGDIVVADRMFCSYCDIASLQRRRIDSVFRINATRPVDFRRGERLGKDDHIVAWRRPARCPASFSRGEFALLPRELRLREIRIQVRVPGWRTRTLVVTTTLLDHKRYTKSALEQLYRQRWQGEVDLRSLKSTLQMDVLRCKTPSLVRKEIWTHLLANNLLRNTMSATAERHNVEPRQLSFRATQQLMNAFSALLTTSPLHALDALCHRLFAALAQHPVGNRPNRYEPRKRKRSAKPYPRMNHSRVEERRRCCKPGSA